MAESILGKLRIGLLAMAHGLIDQVLDLNSVEVVRQYVRDLETGIAKLQETLAEMKGSQRTAQRELDRLTGNIDELDTNIDIILTDGNPDNDRLAVDMEARLNDMKSSLADRRQVFNDNDTAQTAIERTLTAVEARRNAMVARIDELERTAEATRAKEAAAAAVEAANNIGVAAGGEPSVDDVAARIERQADAAQARLDAALNTSTEVSAPVDERRALAEAAIEARRKRLAAKADRDVAASSDGDHTTAASRLTA